MTSIKDLFSLNVNLHMAVATMILLFSNLIFVLPLNNINGQISYVYVNNNNTNDALGNTTIIASSSSQTQEAKINPCLNMMNPGMMTGYAYNAINGSIKLGTNLNSSLSQIKISLSQAATMAEQEIGNNSHAVEAYLCNANGYLIYMIWLRNSNTGNTTDVLVDPANGKTLLKNSNLFPSLSLSQQQQQQLSMNMMTEMFDMNH
jgi:uncharacterized membrane protein YkoI